MAYEAYPFFKVEKNPATATATLWLNRPDKKNVLTWPFWMDLPKVVAELDEDPEVRVVVVAGAGPSFSIGIDFKDFLAQTGELFQNQSALSREKLYRIILNLQQGFVKIRQSHKIFIAAVHGYCLGGGVDLACACDMRLGAADALVSVRETKVAIVADMGTLQRLPNIVGEGNARLMAYTGRDFDAQSCLKMGFFTELFVDFDTLYSAAQSLAQEIAANSAITLRGVKQAFYVGESAPPEDGLRAVALWNAAFLQSADFNEAVEAFFQKRKPDFLK